MKIKPNKSAFTLVEVLISIILFSMIVIFLYQALDITKKTNQFFSSKLEIKQNKNKLKEIFFLDLMNKIQTISTNKDNQGNSLVAFKSKYTYHNPFYQHITYLVTKKNNLVRIESKAPFDKEKLYDTFFDNAYIDILYRDIKRFQVIKGSKIFFFISTKKDKQIRYSF